MSINLSHGGNRGKMRALNPRLNRPFGLPRLLNPLTGQRMPVIDARNDTPLDVAVMTVIAMRDDYIVCSDLNRTEVYVAKPYLLRTNPFDGNTSNGVSYAYVADTNGVIRVASADGESDETQIITPSYYLNEEITAVAADTGLVTALGPVLWADLNTAGRCWAVFEA